MMHVGPIEKKHCRWCGKPYMASKPVGKDGFDNPKCKQAHYRAYKSYVTRLIAISPADQARRLRRRVTQKKSK